MTLTNTLAIGAIILYSLLSVVMLMRLAHGKTDKPTKSTLLIIGMLAVVLHGILLPHHLLINGSLDKSVYSFFSLISWLITLLLLLAAIREPVENLAIGSMPFAALAILLRLINHEHHSISTHLSVGLEVHILISLIAYSLLSIAALQSILLYIQDSQLHNKHPGGFVRALPPLQTMERLLFRLITIGFVILSVSIVSGFFYLENIMQQRLAHKLVFSISGWIIFAILLWGRWQYGWRGRIAIRWTLSGFILLLLAYFGSKIVIELILQR